MTKPPIVPQRDGPTGPRLPPGLKDGITLPLGDGPRHDCSGDLTAVCFFVRAKLCTKNKLCHKIRIPYSLTELAQFHLFTLTILHYSRALGYISIQVMGKNFNFKSNLCP